jgi:PAS domain S-box-containing protein
LLGGLDVTGEYRLPDPELSRLRIGVAQDQPLLHALLVKAMRAVTPEQKEALLARWAVVEHTPEQRESIGDYQPPGSVLILGVAIAVVVALLIVALLVFLRSLSPSRQLALLADERFRVAVYFIAVSFLALILFVGQLSLQRLEAGARESHGEVLSAATRSVEAKLNLWFLRQFTALEDFVSQPPLQDAVFSLLASEDEAGQAAAQQTFRDLMAEFADHEEYYYALLDGAGTVLAADNVNLIGMKYPQPELVALLPSVRDANRGTLLPPRVDLNQEGHHLTLLRPLQISGQVQPLYLLIEAGDKNQYQDILRSAHSGVSGETYLVNLDAEMLNESRFAVSLEALAVRHPGLLSADGMLRLRDPGVDLNKEGGAATAPEQWPPTLAVQEVLKGREGVNTAGYRDYRGVPVLGAWSWSPELGLGTISEIDVDEVLRDYRVVSHFVYAALATVALLIVSMLGAVLWLSDRGRKYLETQLRHGREELRAVGSAVEQSPVAVLITNLDGCIEYVNPAFCAITGYASDEVIGRNPRLLQSGLTPKAYYESLWKTILRGEVWRGDITNRTRDGQLIKCEQIIAPVLDSDGETTHFVGLLQDVSESRQLLADLERLEASRSESLRAAKAAVWEWDIAAGAWRWDQAFPAMLGLPAEANSGDGSWFLQYIFPEDRELVESTLKHATKTGEAVEIDYRMRHVDGSTVYIHARGQVRRNAEGRSVFIVRAQFRCHRTDASTSCGKRRNSSSSSLCWSPRRMLW